MTVDLKLGVVKSGKQTLLTGELPKSEKPGSTVTVEIENWSSVPFMADAKDTYMSVTASVDKHGRFAVPVDVQGGDVLRVAVTGQKRSMVDIRVNAAGGLTSRPAEVSQQGLRLRQKNPGTFELYSVTKNDRIAAPGSLIKFVNTSTKKETIFTLDSQGRLPKGATLAGDAHHTFELFPGSGDPKKPFVSSMWSTLGLTPTTMGHEAILPAPPSDERGLSLKTFSAPLFGKSGLPDVDDPAQGALGDCWLVATAIALAATAPSALRDCFQEHDDGSVTVTFKRWDAEKNKFIFEPVKVDRELYTKNNELRFGSTNGSPSRPSSLWFPILEKAYAVWKGGYEPLTAGYPYELFEALSGKTGTHHSPHLMEADALWATLQKAESRSAPMVTWTKRASADLSFNRTGLVEDHAYAVLGPAEKDGVRGVNLVNPWRVTEPGGKYADGKDDGSFFFPLERFQEFFCALGVGPASPDC